MKRRIVILAALASMVAMPALAAPTLTLSERAPVLSTQPAATPLRYAQNRVSPAQAKQIALRAAGGGEVLDIRRAGDGYVVRIATRDGRRRDIYVDATTGRVR